MTYATICCLSFDTTYKLLILSNAYIVLLVTNCTSILKLFMIYIYIYSDLGVKIDKR